MNRLFTTEDAYLMHIGLEYLIKHFHNSFNPAWLHAVPLINILSETHVRYVRNVPVYVGGYSSEKYIDEVVKTIQAGKDLWTQLEQRVFPVNVPAMLQDNRVHLSGF